MYKVDYHLHTKYSFDGDKTHDNSVDAVCRAALEAGLSEIAITDHHEINYDEDSGWDATDFDAVYREVLESKERYKGRLEVLFGTELGQATQRDIPSREFLIKYPFEFVIGSLHNNRDTIDPYFIDYDSADRDFLVQVWDNYFVETLELVEWGRGRINTLGHISYPRRYFTAHGYGDIATFDTKRDILDEIFKKLIEYGIALEVNTSGYRQGLSDTLPPMNIVSRYLELGGEMITVGSDAHNTGDCGRDIERALCLLSDMGLKYITVFREGKPVMKKINQ